MMFGQFFINIFDFFERIIGFAFPFISALLIILFGYQLIRFLSSSTDVEDHEKFRKRMINAFIAVFLWFVLFGLITTIAGTFNIGVGTDVDNTQIPGVEF